MLLCHVTVNPAKPWYAYQPLSMSLKGTIRWGSAGVSDRDSQDP